MAFLENTGLERVWGHIVHRLSLKADKEDLKLKADKATDEDAIDFIREMGYAEPAMASENAIYTNGEDKIYTL